jgi:hypothetical protein
MGWQSVVVWQTDLLAVKPAWMLPVMRVLVA